MDDFKIDKEKLLEIFLKINERLEGKEATLYAVGGTALTYLELKDFSIDMDFILNPQDWNSVGRVLDGISEEYGVRIDKFFNGHIIYYTLPLDFREKTLDLVQEGSLKMEAPCLTDILLMKWIANRPKDEKDIGSILKNLESDGKETSSRLESYSFDDPLHGYIKKALVRDFIIDHFSKIEKK